MSDDGEPQEIDTSIRPIIRLSQSHDSDVFRVNLTIEVALSGLEEIQSTMSREQLLMEKIIKEVADAIQPGWLEGQEPQPKTVRGVYAEEGHF